MADFFTAVQVLVGPVLPVVLGVATGLAFISWIVSAVSGGRGVRP